MVLHRRSCLIPCLAAGLFLVACKDTKITSYRVPKDSGSSSTPAASVQAPMATTNDLPPDARGQPGSAPLATDALPPGHPQSKKARSPTAADAGMASTPVPAATDRPLGWTAPAGWTPKAASAMRKGSYTVNGPEGAGDLSISALPGDGGGDLANVNRWRGQLQLPPVPELAGAVQPLDANGLHMLIFEGANNGTRMLGVIVPRSGETWFFKLTGPDALVARETSAFLDFLKTVRAP